MDKTELIKLKKQLQLVNDTVSNDVYNLGEEFFEKIVLKLNETLEADFTFVGKLSEDFQKIDTIAIVDKKGVIDNFTYDLKDTPCENVIGQHACSYPKEITQLYPKDQLLIDLGIEAYVGAPLFDSKKNPVGILVCLYKKEIKDIFAIESILMIFASRASAELEHLKLYKALEKHKNELESKVDERTKELNEKNTELKASNQKLAKTLQNLQKTQLQLVQSEKMATLGTLTSGVAHEINNPLNYIMGAYLGLVNYFDKYKSFDKKKTHIILKSINMGIDKISKIVNGLNQFSRNNDNMDEDCDLHSILNNSFEILNSQTKNTIKIIKNYSDKKIITKGNSGKLHQVFLNLFSNSIQAVSEKGIIKVTTKIDNKNVIIKIKDNGIGVDKKILDKIIDPFFTTKPPGEGTGLGLSIAISIIKEHNGILKIDSELNSGSEVLINLPLTQN